jgi:hypothetical protein
MGLIAAILALIGLLVAQPGTKSGLFWLLLALIFVGLSLSFEGLVRSRFGSRTAPP